MYNAICNTMKKLLRLTNLLLLLSAMLVCDGQSQQALVAPAVQEMASPAQVHSGEPNLFATADGRVFLSWIEKLGDDRHTLKFAVLRQGKWSPPQTIAEGRNWFVNWADFPSLIELQDGSLVAHWLVKSAAQTYAYNINLSRSSDGGKTWSKPLVPHRDHTPTEHGFVSLLPLSKGRAGIVWLDGRNFNTKEGEKAHGGHGSMSDEMTLRYALMDARGKLSDEAQIDARACECCQTSAAVTGEGLIVAYRDRSEKEVRDIAIARQVKGKWMPPSVPHKDDWQINGCPVNGPSIAAAGKKVVVAWFTAAKDVAKVKVAFSDDAGATFGEAIQADDGKPLGRVEVLMLPDQAALLVWLERSEKGAEIRARRIQADATKGASFVVAQSNVARASGFPQIALSKDEIIFAWTQTTPEARVKLSTMKLAALK
jgi:hypothetical protein